MEELNNTEKPGGKGVSLMGTLLKNPYVIVAIIIIILVIIFAVYTNSSSDQNQNSVNIPTIAEPKTVEERLEILEQVSKETIDGASIEERMQVLEEVSKEENPTDLSLEERMKILEAIEKSTNPN